MSIKTAIVILNYNSSEDCAKCIAGLQQQKDVDCTIILVDNCSRPEEQNTVRNLCEKNGCVFLQNTENRGYNAGNNTGLRYAAEHGFEYALIANPDMIFERDDFLKTLVDIMKNDPQIAMCSSDIITPEGVHQNPKAAPEVKWHQSFGWVRNIFSRKNQTQVPDWVDSPTESHFCTTLNGCCLLLRVTFLQEVGFFDERTFLYGEEPILARQVELSGKKAFYTTATQAIHNHRKSREGSASFCAKYWKQSQLLYNWYYSGYPFYGKCFVAFSIHTFFAVLNIYHWLKGDQRHAKN